MFFLFLCVGLLWGIINVVFLFFVILFLFRRSFCPCHHIADTNKCLFFFELVHFESRNNELRLFQVASVQIIDEDIRVKNNFFEELDFASLNSIESTSMTFLTPSGTGTSPSEWQTVPKSLCGLSGCRWSFLSLRTSSPPTKVSTPPMRYLMGTYGGGCLTTGACYS